jgi:hypothetical protein
VPIPIIILLALLEASLMVVEDSPSVPLGGVLGRRS